MKFFLRKKKIVILVIGFLLLVFLNFFEEEIRNFFYLLSEPLQRIFFRAGQKISGFLKTIPKMGELEKENKALFLENQELKSQIVSLRELRKENKALREALGLALQEDFQLLLSHIVSKNPFQDSILIDRGRKDGVFEGAVLITPGKALLGKVEKVYNNFSEVLLITDKKSSFPAEIQSREVPESGDVAQPEGVTGIIKGGEGFELFFDLIPQEAKIQRGQEVATISLDGAFPRGLLVGTVEEIEKSDLVPYQKARVKPAFDLKSLDSVFVIINFLAW